MEAFEGIANNMCTAGPLPRFEAVNIVYPTGPSSNSPPPPVIPPQPTGPAGMIRVPPLMPQDVEKFTALFEKSGAIDGLLQGGLLGCQATPKGAC